MMKALLVAVLVLACAGSALSENHEETATDEVTEAAEVTGTTEARPVATPETKVAALFQSRCIACHGGERPAAGMSLAVDGFVASLTDVPSTEAKKLARVDTGNPEASYLLMKLRGDKGIQGSRMPIGLPALEEEELQIVVDWIELLAAERAEAAAESDGGEAGAAAAGAATAGGAAAAGTAGETEEVSGKKKP